MAINIQRRTFMVGAGFGLHACATQPVSPLKRGTQQSDDDWNGAAKWLAAIREPKFPEQDFYIHAYGAKVGLDASAAIQQAIVACHNAGGGRVVIPAGEYLTGPIHLLSNVNLHLVKNATLKFDTNPSRYLPAVHTRWEGMEIMGYSPLIYAYKQQNVAVTGQGVLDGQADREHWWHWKGEKGWGKSGSSTQQPARDQLVLDVAQGKPLAERKYAEGSYLRPSFIQFYGCQSVKVEGITILNSPFWLIHPLLSEHVVIRGVTLHSKGPNSDGCDPESCRNVLIENCLFDTGDDCIAIKSGRNRDGRDIGVASEYIYIRNCKMLAGHGGIVIGSEISGGARNIFVENCEMSSPDLERGVRIKTNSVRGGVIENLFVRKILIGDVADAIVINFRYEEGDAGNYPPTVKNIHISDLTCVNAKNAFMLQGFTANPVGSLYLHNIEFKHAENIGVIENAPDITWNNVMVNGALFTGN